MSAFFSFLYPDRVQVLTDGAWLDPERRLLAIARKVMVFPSHKIAMTGRGKNARDVFQVVEKALRISQTEGAEKPVDQVLEMIQLLFDLLSDGDPFDAEFLIAAWSETQGPVHYFVPCHRNRPEPEPFQLHPMGQQICAGPTVVWDDLKHLGLPPSAIHDPLFPERYGADIVEIMRGRPDRVSSGEAPAFIVGGHCELTTIEASGVTSRILCRWDEVLNAPIDPTNRRVA